VTERWETTDEIAAARQRFETAIPGWVPPAAYGVGSLADEQIEFVHVNVGDHPLPAAVLATVTGHSAGSACYRLTRAELGRAIELLAPAEACTAYEHPNLAAWRWLYGVLREGESAVAVFVGDLNQRSDDRPLSDNLDDF
jgi:hypothetical protein